MGELGMQRGWVRAEKEKEEGDKGTGKVEEGRE